MAMMASRYPITTSSAQARGARDCSRCASRGHRVHLHPAADAHDRRRREHLAAERFCREQRAILVINPRRRAGNPQAAIVGLKALGFHSDSAAMFYPRIVCTDRLRGRAEVFGSGGAAAGISRAPVRCRSASRRCPN